MALSPETAPPPRARQARGPVEMITVIGAVVLIGAGLGAAVWLLTDVVSRSAKSAYPRSVGSGGPAGSPWQIRRPGRGPSRSGRWISPHRVKPSLEKLAGSTQTIA